MLDEVNALLKTVKLDQGAHFFLAAVENDIDLSFYLLLLACFVLLQVELCDD